MNRIILLLAAVIALLPFAASSAHADGYTFKEIMIPGTVANYPVGIAANGTISGFYVGMDGYEHGYLLRNGSVQTVDYPGAARTQLGQINASGKFLGAWLSADYRTGAYFVGGGKGSFTPIEFPLQYGYPAGINASGVIAATTYGPDFIGMPVLIRNGQATPLDTPVGVNGAWLDGGINAHGAIAGDTYDEDDIAHTFLLDGGRTTWIDYPDALGTVPTGINDHNQVVGFYETQDYELRGYVYDNGRFTSVDYPAPPELPDYPGFELLYHDTGLYGINNRGEVVGFFDAIYINWDTFDTIYIQIPFLATPK